MSSHRSLSQRMAAWLMVALLALVAGEPLRAHDCPVPMRSVSATAAAAQGDDAAGEAHHGHHAGHGATDAAATAPTDHQGDHGCECVGECSTVAPVATPHALAVRTTTALVAPPVLDAGAPLAAVPAGEHVLPFAIGPPTRV